MNKKTFILLALTLIFSFNSIYADNALQFPDVPKDKTTEWYYDNLEKLYNKKIVEGDDKGYFNPNNDVAYNEYLKMIIVAIDNKNYTASKGENWDAPYNNRAIKLGIIDSNEIKNYKTKINRYEMAKIIVKACKEEYGDYNKYKTVISDFNTIPQEYEEYVLKAYSKGLINGLGDGSFGGTQYMTRSQAVTVIARLIDKSQRVTPKDPGKKQWTEKEMYDVTSVEEYKQLIKEYNDLSDVVTNSKADIRINGPKNYEFNPNDVDLTVLLWVAPQTPLEPQYIDVENLFIKRFGKDNKTIKEVMEYIKRKKEPKYDLPNKKWQLNGHTIKVSSSGGNYHMEITVWRKT